MATKKLQILGNLGTTNEKFIINVLNDDGVYSADKTYDEILAAYESGKELVCSYTTTITSDYGTYSYGDVWIPFCRIVTFGDIKTFFFARFVDINMEHVDENYVSISISKSEEETTIYIRGIKYAEYDTTQPYFIQVIDLDGVCTINRTFQQVLYACESGRELICKYTKQERLENGTIMVVPGSSNIQIPCSYIDSHSFRFTRFYRFNGSTEDDCDNYITIYIENIDGETSVSSSYMRYATYDEIPTVPTQLPNPKALDIKVNGETTTYDGSSSKTINIEIPDQVTSLPWSSITEKPFNEEIVLDTTFELAGFNGLLNTPFTLNEGTTYKLKGVSGDFVYEVTATALGVSDDGITIIYMGNLSLMDASYPNTGEPYMLVNIPSMESGFFGMDTSAGIPENIGSTLSLTVENLDAVKKLDSKFMGDIEGSNNAYKMLVTDADGNTKWEERTHYHSIGEIANLPEYTYSSNDQVEVFGLGEMAIKTPFVLTEGDTCTVNYNGTDYVCKVSLIEDLLTLGNAKALNDALPGNDEPFVLFSTNGYDLTGDGCYGAILPFDGATNGTISIRSITEELKKIPKKFLPEPLPVGEAEEDIVYLAETTETKDDLYSRTEWAKIPEDGQNLIVKWNGVEYECKAINPGGEYLDIVIGDASSSGGEYDKQLPFEIALFKKSNEAYQAGYRAVITGKNEDASLTSFTLSVYVPKGFNRRLPYKYIDVVVSPTLNIISTDYIAAVSGETRIENPTYYIVPTTVGWHELFKKGRVSTANLFCTQSVDGSPLILPAQTMEVVDSSTEYLYIKMTTAPVNGKIATVTFYTHTGRINDVAWMNA